MTIKILKNSWSTLFSHHLQPIPSFARSSQFNPFSRILKSKNKFLTSVRCLETRTWINQSGYYHKAKKNTALNGNSTMTHFSYIEGWQRFALFLMPSGLISGRDSRYILTSPIKEDCLHAQLVKQGKRDSHGHGCGSRKKALWLKIS